MVRTRSRGRPAAVRYVPYGLRVPEARQLQHPTCRRMANDEAISMAGNMHLLTCSPAHLLTCSPAHLLTHSPARLLTYSPARLFTYSPTDLLGPPAPTRPGSPSTATTPTTTSTTTTTTAAFQGDLVILDFYDSQVLGKPLLLAPCSDLQRGLPLDLIDGCDALAWQGDGNQGNGMLRVTNDTSGYTNSYQLGCVLWPHTVGNPHWPCTTEHVGCRPCGQPAARPLCSPPIMLLTLLLTLLLSVPLPCHAGTARSGGRGRPMAPSVHQRVGIPSRSRAMPT